MLNVLPRHFPKSFRESPDYRKVLRFYEQFTEDYYREYGFGHFIMAAYAAVPALLTPDLLYKIWLNFNQYEWRGQQTSIHRMAIADVLLSDMCREVGYELYEMLPEVRDAFVEWLTTASKSEQWRKRGLHPPSAIAKFVQAYHQRQNIGTLRWGNGYEEVQDWNSLVFLNPKAVGQKLAQKLQQALATNQTEALRIMDFWAKAKRRVEITAQREDVKKEFGERAVFAGALKSLMQRNSEAFLQQLNEFPQLRTYLTDDESGIPVEVNSDVAGAMEQIQPPTLHTLLIGIDEYPQEEISSLSGCVNDANALSDFLARYATTQDQESNSTVLVNQEATFENVVRILENWQNLRNGDTVLLYFAGHSNYLDTYKKEGKELLFYDSELERQPIVKGKGGRPQRNDRWQKVLTQANIEEILSFVVQQKVVHFLLLFDTHTADES
ncbi:MAG: caspase family protein, partial [Saprospiraceae bacterium]